VSEFDIVSLDLAVWIIFIAYDGVLSYIVDYIPSQYGPLTT